MSISCSKIALLTFTATIGVASVANAAPKPPPPPIDSCLVGTWKTTGVASFLFTNAAGDGAGVVLKIDRTGQEEIDYDAMAPLHIHNAPLPPDVHYYRGRAGAFFATPTPGHPKLVNMQFAALMNHAAIGGIHSADHPAGKTVGPGALGNDPNGTYICTQTTLDVRNTVYAFHYARVSAAPPKFGAGPGKPPKPGPQPPINSQFCVQNSGAVADIAPCTGAVVPGGFPITLTLKKAIPSPLAAAQFLPPRATSGVTVAVAGAGTTVGSTYTIVAPASLCMNTGATYSVRVFIGGVSYGDVGNFVPDCR